MDCAGQAAISTGVLQDGMVGRDKTVNNSADGRLGFSYSKISPTGAVLANTAVLGSGVNNWACTKDNVTGLIWEVKTSDGGLQDQNKGFTYFTDTTSIQKYSTSGPASLAPPDRPALERAAP